MASYTAFRITRSNLLIFTACGEAATGLSLLAVPSIPLRLLIGLEQPISETILVARVAGAALIGIGAGCWIGRNDIANQATDGLIAGILVYSTLVAAVLVYASVFLGRSGIALWPAVAIHAMLSIACVQSVRNR